MLERGWDLIEAVCLLADVAGEDAVAHKPSSENCADAAGLKTVIGSVMERTVRANLHWLPQCRQQSLAQFEMKLRARAKRRDPDSRGIIRRPMPGDVHSANAVADFNGSIHSQDARAMSR
ncbi:hypothetical protein ACFSQT_02025 [Mesorhizobium calcicola]|uniref:Transposase n=1 Tax=Mesorhizobium calcicola TaxID=1300310 RepID=A0ABW4W8B6_9HYPH